MKSKTYRYGKYSCKTYYKTVGNGFETGFVFGGKPVFVGNFIHANEAQRWFGIMNHEIRRFGRKYTVGHAFPAPWFMHFMKNHLYKFYYAYLDKLFARYNRDFHRAFTKDFKKYKQMKHRYWTHQKTPFLKAA
jgi:hypothetical protein